MALALIALAVMTTEASAQSTTRSFRNSKGQSIGRSTTSGNTTTFYDSRVINPETTTGDNDGL